MSRDLEKKRAHDREYYLKNREQIRAQAKAYRKLHKEKVASQQKAYQSKPEAKIKRQAYNRARDPLIAVYNTLLSRCYNPRHEGFYLYGGRGIEVCHEWRKSFAAFKEWALTHGWQKGLHIDRRDNDGDYSPDNCQCITGEENNRKRPYVKLTIEKAREIRRLSIEGMTTRQLAEIFNVSMGAIEDIKYNRTWK